jgi:hypothetical protein
VDLYLQLEHGEDSLRSFPEAFRVGMRVRQAASVSVFNTESAHRQFGERHVECRSCGHAFLLVTPDY